MGNSRIDKGRPCRICSSSDRQAIELALVTNTAVSSISNRFGLSVSGVNRHVKAHMAPELRETFRASQRLNARDLIARVAEIANDALSTRKAALVAGQDVAALKAGDAELRALSVLTNRFGIDDLLVLDQLTEAQNLARAVGSLASTHPDAVRTLAAALELNGATEMATALSAVLKNERKEGS